MRQGPRVSRPHDNRDGSEKRSARQSICDEKGDAALVRRGARKDRPLCRGGGRPVVDRNVEKYPVRRKRCETGAGPRVLPEGVGETREDRGGSKRMHPAYAEAGVRPTASSRDDPAAVIGLRSDSRA